MSNLDRWIDYDEHRKRGRIMKRDSVLILTGATLGTLITIGLATALHLGPVAAVVTAFTATLAVTYLLVWRLL